MRGRSNPVAFWRTATRVQRSLAIAAMVTVVIAIIGFISLPTASPARAAHDVTIAVLPFNDRSTDASLGTLAGTLSDELVRGLSQGSLLSVISTNGVLQMREQGTPEDSLGRMLGADYLVGGSVTRYGDQMRMDVELLDGRTGQVLRTGVFERPWSESRNLVEDVVRAAALFLRGELGTRLELARVQAGTANEDAWRLVVEAKAAQRPIVTLLKAREFPVALSILQRADSMLEAAARLDTEWVEPVVERGWVSERQALIARFTGDLELQRNRLDEALRHARRAAEMKSDYAGAYALRGSILHLLSLLPQPAAEATAALTAAEDDLRRAAELDPLDQPALRRLADLLYSIGKYGEAKAAAESAFRIDPYSPDAAGLTYQLFSTSFETGLDSEADGWCFQGRKQFPDELIFVYCLLALHAWADGLEPEPDQLRIELGNFQQGERRLQPDLMSRFETMIAAAYARAGQPDSAYAILDRIAATSADRGALWMRASVYAALGEDSTALYLLNEYRVYGGWRAVRVVESRPFWNLNERTGIRRVNSRDKSRP
ncbi:MAG: hypothetical protein KFH98_12460 [Gemmatimonadetes bacterium]|nr:hypothetical protein [Gemmatimonadota bacterium]